MPTFFYKTCTARGKVTQGILRAASRQEALQSLSATDTSILCLERQYLSRHSFKASSATLILLCRQLSLLLHANVSLQEALSTLAKHAPAQLGHFFCACETALQQGQTFSDAVKKSGVHFPAILYAFIVIGETSGRLDLALEKAAHYLQYSHLAKERLKTASLYPAIVFSALCISVGAIHCFVLPPMQTLLYSLHIPLPWFTRFLLQSNSPLYLCIAFAALIAAGAYTYQCHRRIFYRKLFRLPLLGRLFHEIFLLRLCSSLDALLGAGISLHDSIVLLRQNTDNVYLNELLERAAAALACGAPLSAAWTDDKQLPPLFLQLVTAGEASGNLTLSFTALIDFYKNDLDLLQKRSIALLEPCLLIVLAVCVGSFVIAIALPLLDAVSYANI